MVNMLAEPRQAAVVEPVDEVSSNAAPDEAEGTEQNGPGLSDSGRAGRRSAGRSWSVGGGGNPWGARRITE